MKTNTKIIFSLATVLVTAFLTHYFFISKIDETGREVAAFSERNNPQQIKWEQTVAEELSKKSNGQKLQNSVKPSWQDQLAYEFFRGQYDISVDDGQINKISLQNSMDGVNFTADEMIEKFGHQLKSFSTYKKNQISAKTESVNLFNDQGVVVGSFEIVRADDGRVLEFLIK